VCLPKKQIVAAPPRMPNLLYFAKCVEDRFSDTAFGVAESLNEHSGIYPRERSPYLLITHDSAVKNQGIQDVPTELEIPEDP